MSWKRNGTANSSIIARTILVGSEVQKHLRRVTHIKGTVEGLLDPRTFQVQRLPQPDFFPIPTSSHFPTFPTPSLPAKSYRRALVKTYPSWPLLRGRILHTPSTVYCSSFHPAKVGLWNVRRGKGIGRPCKKVFILASALDDRVLPTRNGRRREAPGWR